MDFATRQIDRLSIDLLTDQDRKDQARRALSIEERTKRALAKGDALLRQARLVAALQHDAMLTEIERQADINRVAARS